MTIISSMAPVIGPEANVLILGSMPGIKSLEKQQYYGNPRNHFWSIISELLNTDITTWDYEQKCSFLIENKIALWDVLASCERKGSLDSAIRQEEMNDLNSLIQDFPTIKWIGLNGTKAYQSFQKYRKTKEFPAMPYTKLPSSSPVPGKNVKTFEEKVISWHVVHHYLNLTGEK
ncbi:DNA-deoxyinosine glycosylase [Salipaludibacillus daqingensis]|uniref:DNA-deoxyinosine glycosylase n=1 Tax=Salipaludibacillus daqingensis TaxID=3041001 RepID=UPI002477203B|nr:DNA-deoxyinosine glycosylase [Salipaludibacillus daqingensis]